MLKILGVSALSLSLAGCLFVVDSKQKVGSTQWYQSDLDRVVEGQTSAQWVRDAFGEPSRVSRFDDGSEIWRYRNSSSSSSEVGLFLLFSVDVEEDKEEVLSLEIRDGVVRDFWVEKS